MNKNLQDKTKRLEEVIVMIQNNQGINSVSLAEKIEVEESRVLKDLKLLKRHFIIGFECNDKSQHEENRTKYYSNIRLLRSLENSFKLAKNIMFMQDDFIGMERSLALIERLKDNEGILTIQMLQETLGNHYSYQKLYVGIRYMVEIGFLEYDYTIEKYICPLFFKKNVRYYIRRSCRFLFDSIMTLIEEGCFV